MAKTISLTSRQVTRGLVSYLNKTKRLGLLTQIISEAKKSTRNYADPNLAVIETAIALTDSQVDSIRQQLQAIKGNNLEIVTKVNPDLIAGMKLKIGDQVFDQSLRHQIDQLAAVVHE